MVPGPVEVCLKEVGNFIWISIQTEAHSITATGLHEILANQSLNTKLNNNI